MKKTNLDSLLARTLLVFERTVPRDTVPARDPDPNSPRDSTDPNTASAAEDLRALCEALVTHTPADAVADFLTDQVPEPRSAMVLACVLQLTDTDDGARFWWQYAAGAGHAAAAYCLYLHHLALGETHAARWWHKQTDDDIPVVKTVRTTVHRDNKTVALFHEEETSAATLLRLLRRLGRTASRPRSAVVAELMAYMPTAVAVGYLREPDSEIPLPGDKFAQEINTLLTASATRPDHPSNLPARARGRTRPGPRQATVATGARIPQTLDEAASR
ncbi:hypothetical protein GCM10010497_58460 [Streptomyces cinereoruber]|uniref:Uncharacterized protein n=1 Tax=Streptomyces cinereoruber TaxID=67260 RepID=A0AAV4KT21_9ACTN|nr:hypothetical protein [Streptomyces cinereoruber]MBB4161801.1 hypothetical protein [Streptomyces cinereoruber]NIH65486.1 hypothetical protein [Streptomyces cinereoruber]QEV30815.1 hypothetical protein CP977_00080 [Streptomyces cinereoruber]GGR47428.1 hypothetical protein GCM10010497_58460 [Streptomyces cinereoruber]